MNASERRPDLHTPITPSPDNSDGRFSKRMRCTAALSPRQLYCWQKAAGAFIGAGYKDIKIIPIKDQVRRDGKINVQITFPTSLSSLGRAAERVEQLIIKGQKDNIAKKLTDAVAQQKRHDSRDLSR